MNPANLRDGEYLFLEDWRNTNTTGVVRCSDAHLLYIMETIPLCRGWGVVAELMKRFEKYSNEFNTTPNSA